MMVFHSLPVDVFPKLRALEADKQDSPMANKPRAQPAIGDHDIIWGRRVGVPVDGHGVKAPGFQFGNRCLPRPVTQIPQLDETPGPPRKGQPHRRGRADDSVIGAAVAGEMDIFGGLKRLLLEET